MDRFLASLSPSLRGQVKAAISDPESRSRLEWVVSRYIDEDGNWPTGPTAQTLAQTFLHQQSDYDGQRFGAAGLGQTTVAALAGGALAIGGGTALQTVASGLVAGYWSQTLAYSTGLNPQFIRQIKKVYDRVAADTPWATITEGLVDQQPTAIDRALNIIISDRLAKQMERSLYGVFKQAAWRGARSGLFHTTGLTIGDASQENAWIEQYVRNFSQNQESMARRTITSIVNDSLERGHGSRAIAERLESLWYLTPRHAQAVENYRRGLLDKEIPARRARDLAKGYASRLHASRLKTLSQSEMHTAFNLGREAQWVKAVQEGTLPIDTAKMWITAQDEAVCPICRPLDGVTTELGSTFEGASSIYVPGAHPNCRCIVVPVSARSTADMSRKRTLIFPARESVSKKMIVIDAYEREDGTPVRRHTRVIGEKSAYEQWKDAPATEHHKKIASFLNSYKFPDMPEREELLPKPSSYPKRPDTRADAPDWGEQLNAYSDALGRFWGSTEGQKFERQLDVAERRWSNQAAKEALDSAPGVDQSVLKSTLFGSRVWTTQSDGVGLVRHVAGMTDYPGHREVDPTQFRESKIRAASNFMNTVRSAPKTNATIYRGINVDDDNYIENLKRGGTLSLPVSSFTDSKEQARHFTGGGGGIPVVFEVSGGVNALRLPDLLSNRRYSESEWVTSGSFTIEDVKPPVTGAGWLLNTAVVTLSQNVSKVHSDHREIEDLLCTPLPREKSVSKHLIGRHDQKKHGRKGTGRREDHGRDDHSQQDKANYFAYSVMAGYAASIGMMFLPGAISKFSLQSIKNIPAASKTTLQQYAKNKEAVKNLQAMPPADKYQWLGEFFNTGGTVTPQVAKAFPEAKHIKDAIKAWTGGGQKSIRHYLVTGGKGNKTYDSLGMALATAPPVTTKLYRGFDASGDILKAYTTKGNTFNLGPTGFSSQKGVAKKFANDAFGYSGSGEPILITMKPNARALRIEKHANISFKWEKEWLSSGRYRVSNTPKKVNGIWEVEIEHIDLLIPNVLKLPNAQQSASAAEKVSNMVGAAKQSNGGLGSFVKSPALMAHEHGPKWWQKFGISDELIQQSGVLTHGWPKKTFQSPEALLALTKRDELDKHLGGHDGLRPHPSGSPQSIHAGGQSDDSEFFWDLTTRALSRGEHASRSALNAEMRQRNKRAGQSLKKYRNGKIVDFSVRQLGVMTEGVGFRIGNENHIKSFANRMMQGENVFRYGNRRDPIMVLVYDDGAQLLDGKHRLAASQMIGKDKVPIQVARIRKPTPQAETFRQEWDELRRNLVRYQNYHNELPEGRPEEPFDVRVPYSVEVSFNEWMSTRSALKDEERFRQHGVERGEKPRFFSRS